MCSAAAKSTFLVLTAMTIGLVSTIGLSAEEKSWKDETLLVSPEGDQTVVRPLEGDKILLKNADPQLAIEWAMANARTTIVLAGQYVVNDAIDVPRDDVTLIIGQQCYEIIDCNASQATVGEIVSIGKSDKFVTLSEGCGARTVPRGRMTPKLDIKQKTILEDAAGATLRVEVPKLPDALPRFTVKATVEVTLTDGSKKEYTKEVEVDVRDGGIKPQKKN